ncbi:hypothetical protein KKF32_02030 [Patescibacteria group bacterium]|nr:hypothetical protein [Patescibacteria group bacterium]
MLFNPTRKKNYAFVLGHRPLLSQKEIEKVLEFQKVDFKEIFLSSQVFIIETSTKLDLLKLQKQLGGTVKTIIITYIITKDKLERTVTELVNSRINELSYQKFIKDGSQNFSRKYQFGFSVYAEEKIKNLSKIGLKIKNDLKARNINSRFVVSKKADLSSVIVHKERLLNQGIDLVIIASSDKYFIGYTVTVQEYEDYSQRDYGRPARDDKSGLLPPKLAKIMINISQTDFRQTILDPFCGSGTILQEALLMGYVNLIASDVSFKAIEKTRHNINWLKTKYDLDISRLKIHQLDATTISQHLSPDSIDRIITEPYLGPSSKIFSVQTPKIISQITDLYLKSFTEFYKILKKEGKVIIIFPIINDQRLDILEQIKNKGFVDESLSEQLRSSLVYSREKQRVKREIFVFKKV